MTKATGFFEKKTREPNTPSPQIIAPVQNNHNNNLFYTVTEEDDAKKAMYTQALFKYAAILQTDEPLDELLSKLDACHQGEPNAWQESFVGKFFLLESKISAYEKAVAVNVDIIKAIETKVRSIFDPKNNIICIFNEYGLSVASLWMNIELRIKNLINKHTLNNNNESPNTIDPYRP